MRIGADPLGGASVDYWGEIAERHRLDLTVVNPEVDPTWRFMTLDWDGKIRMDCSSPLAMASLIGKRRRAYDIATGNDADADRHGIVTPDGGLMNPNHFLAVAIEYLYAHRDGWPAGAGIGKTLVSSSHDRPGGRVASAGGWSRCRSASSGSCPACSTGRSAFGGEESAGASFLRRDGRGLDDRQGRHPALPARLGDPGGDRRVAVAALPALAERFGDPAYARVDAPATREEKAVLGSLSPGAGDRRPSWPASRSPRRLTEAPGNGAAIGGLKVTTESAWFAARPSGTEDVYKIYAESFRGPDHLAQVQDAAREVVVRRPRSDQCVGGGAGCRCG